MKFILFSISIAFVSCKKSQNYVIDGLNNKASIRSGNLVFSESCEGVTIFTNQSKQTYTPYGITQSDSQVFAGAKSVRFELRDTDSMNNNGTRSEVAFSATTILNRWYGFSMYMPSNYWQYDNADDVVMQWHQGGGATPALCFRVRKDTLYVRLMGTTWLRVAGTGSLVKDTWRQYAVHVKFSSDLSTNPSLSTTGLVEININGYWVFQYYGPNMYPVGSTYSTPIWKFGIYKSSWNDNNTTMTNKRVLYFDDIKIGDSTCSEDDFINY